jgi:hypothetical protein
MRVHRGRAGGRPTCRADRCSGGSPSHVPIRQESSPVTRDPVPSAFGKGVLPISDGSSRENA